MKKILFSVMMALMGTLVFTACSNDDNLGVDRYVSYETNFEKLFGSVNPNQNFNTQKTVTIQSSTGKQGTYTLRVYDGKPGKKSTSLIGEFANLNGTSVSTVKVGVSKSLKNLYCVADDGKKCNLAIASVPTKGDVLPDFNDQPGIPTINPDLQNTNTVTIAFEDLGSTYDFDFNDVVITVDHVAGRRTATVTLQALGGVLPVHLSYVGSSADFSKDLFDGKELHEAMGYDVNTMINTNWETKDGVLGVDKVEPITDEITVPADFVIGEDGAPFVVIVNSQEGQRQITADTEAGKTPQVLVLGKYYSEEGTSTSWVWPKEKTGINVAYPTITNWLQNDPSDDSFIVNPAGDQIYEFYNPDQSGETTDVFQAVDLGLPSGTLWANMNLGAEKEEDFGNYYAWGEADWKWDFFKADYDGAVGNLDFTGGTLSIAGTEYDAAHVELGDGWNMPTPEQFQELFDYCYYSWTKVNGVEGAMLTGLNGNSVFFPAAGAMFDDNGSPSYSEMGIYWTDFLAEEDLPNPVRQIFYDHSDDYPGALGVWYYRGMSIRPVKAGTPPYYQNPPLKLVDLGLPSGTIWAERNLGASAPEDKGKYYVWGDVTPMSSNDPIDPEDYMYWQEQIGDILPDKTERISGMFDFDPASYMYEVWQMPTYEQFWELIQKCTFTEVNKNGVTGLEFVGPNYNTLFLPYDKNRKATYWTGDAKVAQSPYEKADCVILATIAAMSTSNRINPCLVRAVYNPDLRE